MNCSKCGAVIQDNYDFCPECGSEVKRDAINSPTVVVQKKRKIILPIIAVIGVVLTLLVVVVVLRASSSDRRLQTQLDLGNRYLSELDYERAVAAFEQVLEIDPKNLDGYTGLIEAYTGLGNADGILEAYDMAVANLDNDSLSVVQESASSGCMVIIDSMLAEGNIDSTWSVTSALSHIDQTASDRAVYYISRYEKGGASVADLSAEEPEDSPGNDGQALMNEGNYSEAVSYYEDEIKANPTEASLYCACAAAYLADDNSLAALEVLEKGIEAGADRAVLIEKEEYIRDNTIITSCHEEINEWEPIENNYSTHGTSDTVYDEAGRKVSCVIKYDDGRTTNYRFDTNGNTIFYEYKYNGGDYQKYTYTYNSYDDPTYVKSESSYSGSYSMNEIYYTYTYDANGHKISEVESSTYYTQTTFYEYDNSGNMIHSAQVYQDDPSSVIEIYNVYDSYGRLISWESVGAVQPSYGRNEYDERGNVIYSSDNWGETDYTYDLMNQRIKSEGSAGISDFETVSTYTYKFIGDYSQLMNV